jgi:Putative Flp pilus-assembly TadE/G-like
MCIGVLTVLGMGALVIESTRLRIENTRLQDIADAASLAAARELNGDVNGWLRAKRAGLSVIATNLRQNGKAVNVTGGADDSLESEFGISGSQGTVNGYSVVIERGVYWADTAGKELEFNSLESDASAVTRATDASANGKKTPFFSNLPTFIVANAVRVKVVNPGMEFPLGKIFRLTENGTITKSSVSTSTSSIEECVIPAAIPACSLLLELDPEQKNQYDTKLYRASNQCQREVVLTEADPLGIDYGEDRREGLLRSELYPRKPYWGTVLNDRAVPIYGVLGTAGGEKSEGPATPEEVLTFVKASGGCKKVKIGSAFKPVENAVGADGIYTRKGQELTQVMRDIVNKGDSTFKDVFGDGTDSKYTKGHMGPTEYSYPHINAEGKELRWKWLEDPLTKMSLSMSLNPPEDLTDFTNPMCHDYGGSFESTTSGIPANDQNQRVKTVTLMVIAPTDKASGGTSAKYCDYAARLGGATQFSSAPEADTKPRVVGFVKAVLFDFNVLPFPTSGRVSPLDNNPKKMTPLIGDLTQLLPGGSGGVATPTEHYEWQYCKSLKVCKPGEESKEGRRRKCKIDEDSCGDDPSLEFKGDTSIPSLITQAYYQSVTRGNCFNVPDYGLAEDCMQESKNLPKGAPIPESCIQFVKELGKEGTFKDEDIVCLPKKREGCFPLSNPRCWTAPTVARSQVGCGGLRVRLSCSQTAFPSLEMGMVGAAPTLVK